MPVGDAVRSAYAAGSCLLPVRADGTKAPDVSGWKQFLSTRPTVTDMQAWDFGSRVGFGIVAGPVSGYRECWDFDTAEVFEAFIEAAHACGLGALVERIRQGYEDTTPGGGRRWIVQYPESVEWKDCTLARRPGLENEPKVKTLIELPTFAILAPSNGATHPSGRPYVRLSGDFATIANYAIEEREALYELARSFDQMPKREAHQSRKPISSDLSGGVRPGDDFNRRAAWPDILSDWTEVYSRDETTYLCRPGKRHGISASLNLGGSDLLYVFTSSTAFDPDKSYSKFAAYAVLHHGADFSKAAKALVRQGYGSRSMAEADPAPVKATTTGPIDLAALLTMLITWVRRYVVVTDAQAVAIVLWAAHTHAIEAADCTPYLQVTSATTRISDLAMVL